MLRKNLDLCGTLGIAVANVVWALFTASANQASLSVISIVLTLPLVLVVPGYVLTEALFPRRALETFQRVAFTIALSLAVTILSGFLLNQLPSGLRLFPWAIWLGLFTVIFSLLAYLRRRKQLLAAQAQVDQTIMVRAVHRSQPQISAFVLFGLAMLVIVLSVLYSVVGAEQQSHPGFTNLSVLPAIKAGNSCAVSIRLQSFELASVSYRVVVTTNKAQTASWASVSLLPQQQWVQLEAIPVGTSTSLFVLVQVYRLDQPQTVYRHVDVTLQVASKGGTAKQCTAS